MLVQAALFTFLCTMLAAVSRGGAFPGRGSLFLSALSRHTSNFQPHSSEQTHNVTTIDEKVVFEGYRNIVRRTVVLPHGQKVDYDILTQKHLSVVVFVWDTKTSTTTLVKEYHPGPNQVMLGTVAGMCENGKHSSILQAAQHELEEEAQLRTDNWYPLLNEGAIMPFDKYSNNKFIPFLALDCEPVKSAKPLDDEEYITIHRNVTYTEMMDLMASGQINVVSTYTIMLGLQKLKHLGIKVE